jgi:ankyrin repeat protein
MWNNSNNTNQTLPSEAGEVDSYLLDAILNMKHEEAKLLLKEGANPNNHNIESTYGTTLLNIAVQNGDITSVAILLEHGADIDRIDSFGLTALHHSAICKQPEICQFLLKKGADSNTTDRDNKTYLSHVGENEDLDNYYITSYSTKSTEGYKEQLIQDKNSLDDEFFAALDFAYHGKPDEFYTEQLIQDMNSLDLVNPGKPDKLNTKTTPTRDDKNDSVTMYGKITPDDRNQTLPSEADEAYSLLNAAKTKNHTEFENLLKRGADSNIALRIAVQNGDITSVAILLEHGADINGTDSLERTVLHYSAIYQQPETCRFLLENGADPSVTDYGKQTYLSYLGKGEELDKYCITSNSTELAKDSTEQRQETLDPKFIQGSRFLDLVASSELNDVETLLSGEPDIDINFKDKEGRTALQIAIEREKYDVVSFLIDRGADASFLDKKSEEEAKANTSIPPSTNPTNLKKEGQLVPESPTLGKRSFSKIS